MIRKMYILIFVLEILIPKNVYALEDNFHIENKGFFTAEMNSNELEIGVQSATGEGYKKKYVLYPILGDLVPIILNISAGLFCMTLHYDKDEDFSDNDLCFTVITPTSFLISAIGTIPSHIYSGTSYLKVIGFTIGKISIGALYGYASLLGLAMSEADDTDRWKEKSVVNKEWMNYLLKANGIILLIEAFEVLSQAMAIKKYNESIENKSEIYLGAVSNNAVGIKYQINF